MRTQLNINTEKHDCCHVPTEIITYTILSASVAPAKAASTTNKHIFH